MNQAPQPIETLPEEPPYPIIVGGVTTSGESWSSTRFSQVPTDADWWMPVPTFEPDPMTVAEWHPMELLPDGHRRQVLIRYESGHTEPAGWTYRSEDARKGRVAWMPLDALLAEHEARKAE